MFELFDMIKALGDGNVIRGFSVALIPICASYVWLSGIMGLMFQDKIMNTYGAVIRPFFEILRMVRLLATPVAISFIVQIVTYTFEGFQVDISFVDIILLICITGLNIYLPYQDNLRFNGHCAPKIARKIKISERRIGCSVLTYLSLLIFLAWFVVLRFSLATSIYMEDEYGNIYAIKKE